MSLPTSTPGPHRGLWLAATILGATAVVAGAFGAHALKARLTPERLASFQTAARYQLVHAVVLLALATVAGRMRRAARIGGGLIAAGVTLFSGSIYGLVLGGGRWLGPVTPLGGSLIIAGWICLAFAVSPAKQAAPQ